MISDLLNLVRRTSVRDLVCLGRELTAWRRMPRTPEPTMAMEAQRQVLAYTMAGTANNGMTAHYRLHAAMAAQRLARCRRVIDLCCGPAVQLAMIAELLPDCEFIGVDLSEGMLESARNHARERGLANISFVHADATRLPFPDRHADGVMSTVALHHLPDQAALHACLGEARRVAGPDPACYVVDLLRPRNAANVPMLSRRDHPSAPVAFIADFEHSWRAAFTSADWARAATILPGCSLVATAPAPLFTVLATPPGPVSLQTAAKSRASLATLSPAGRTTYEDLCLMFRLGGLKSSPPPPQAGLCRSGQPAPSGTRLANTFRLGGHAGQRIRAGHRRRLMG